MKRIIYIAAFALAFASTKAFAQTCPSLVTGISPSVLSCWPMQETGGTVITDTQTEANNGTISGNYTLNQQPGGIACNNSNQVGCNITTNNLYSSPRPFTLYVDFAGVNGGILQLGTSSSVSAVPYYVLFLDNYGRLVFGINNFGTYQVVQSPLPYADGNEHKVVISLGANDALMYVDGQLVAQSGLELSSYASGYWFFGGINNANWPYSPSNQYLMGTLITVAWWNGTQLSDYQSRQLTGGIPATIANNYCTFSNQIASLNPASAQAYANKNLTFTTINTLQIPGAGSALPIGPSQIICKTDSAGNIITGCQVPQGAHVNLSVGNGPPIPMVIPASTSCDLTSIILSQTDPPEVVSAVAVAGPLFAGTTVTNPPVGTIGTSTITAPNAFSQTQALAATVNIGVNGNNQQVIMTGNVAISLTNWQSGASFSIDTTEDGTGGRTPTFSVPGGDTLVWSGGGAQPVMPNTSINNHIIWYFQAVSNTVLVGSLQASGAGTFPLSNTGNANNYSITTLDQATFNIESGPSAITCTATCTGTCATTYTYELTGQGDIAGAETAASSPVTCTNAASLSASNFNTVNFTPSTTAHGGSNIYGRISGALGLLANTTTSSYVDTGAASPGVTPPLYNSTGKITGTNLFWAMGGMGANSTTGDFMPFMGISDSSTENLLKQPAPIVGVIHNMNCQDTLAAPVITLRKNGSNTTLTCTISTNVCTDTKDAVIVAAGDLLDSQVTTAGGNATCSFQVN